MATSTDLRSAIEEVKERMPEAREQSLEPYGDDWATQLQERVGTLPWWVISAAVHAVIFLLCTLIGVALPPPRMDEVIITSDIAKQKEPEYQEKLKRDLFKNPQEVKDKTQVENPVVVHEQTEITDHFETDNDMDNQTARGQEDAISDIPLGGTGVTGVMGVGGGGMAGCFGYRDGGGRKKATARFGGSPATESAVEAALRWLVRNQEADGSWDGFDKWGNCGHGHAGDLGLTGLATLAFLGAGYTHKTGKYKDTVAKAIKYMLDAQHKDPDETAGRYKLLGAIYFLPRDKRLKGNNKNWWIWGSYGYNHAICGLALAEAYGMSKDETLKKPAQMAVDYSTNVHQTPYGGWRYKIRTEADMSNTGWFVMQLKSAKVAGLKVDGSSLQGAMNFVNKCTEKDGGAIYTLPNYRHKGSRASTPMMTSIGMVCRIFMGAKNDDAQLQGGGKYLGDWLPRWDQTYPKEAHGDKKFYYWYYGTLGMFQMGGKHWELWNKDLKEVLVKNQCTTAKDGAELDGSWHPAAGKYDPAKPHDGGNGRVFATTMGALCLEVYYRYLPMYAGD